MAVSIPVVWSERVLLHEPEAEIWVGVRTPGTEVPDRARVILASLREVAAPVLESIPHDDTVLRGVHSQGMLEHLRTAWSRWGEAGMAAASGQNRVVPYVFPTEGMLAGMPIREATAIHAAAGLWCYDTMTLIGPGTWEAARAAVDATLTAVDLVTRGDARAAYALTRPPGHHATRDAFGGSCYLNNAAVAAEAMRRAGHDKVAVVDIDAHHGNGTQAIFYDRADLLYASLHVDPGTGWFPHYVGFADETGRGQGSGSTLNVPLEPGTGDGPWLAALGRLAAGVTGWSPTALVISLGVDAAADDPESPLQVTPSGYAQAGELLAALDLPTVIVQEGGYHMDTLGPLVAATLAAFG